VAEEGSGEGDRVEKQRRAARQGGRERGRQGERGPGGSSSRLPLRSVSVQACTMPKETLEMRSIRERTMPALRARLACAETCISAAASSAIVFRQSVRWMRYGLMAKKATICSPTSSSASEPGRESQKVSRNMTIAKAVKPSTPWMLGLRGLSSVAAKKRRSCEPTAPSYSAPEATACRKSSRSYPFESTHTFERSTAETTTVESAISVSVWTWSLVTRRILCFCRISFSRITMKGTKSSVTPANGSSSTSSRSDEPAVRCLTSSKRSILRCPPDSPLVNWPAMVPPICTLGLYDTFCLPSSNVFSE